MNNNNSLKNKQNKKKLSAVKRSPREKTRAKLKLNPLLPAPALLVPVPRSLRSGDDATRGLHH